MKNFFIILFLWFGFLHCGAPQTEEGGSAQKSVTSQPSTGVLPPPPQPAPAPTPTPGPAGNTPTGTTVTSQCATMASTYFIMLVNGSWNDPSEGFFSVRLENGSGAIISNSALSSQALIDTPVRTGIGATDLTDNSNKLWLSSSPPQLLTVDSVVMSWPCSDGSRTSQTIYTRGSNLQFPDPLVFARPTAP